MTEQLTNPKFWLLDRNILSYVSCVLLFQIREFVDFREKLQRSFQYKSAATERLLLDLILETNSHTGTEQMLTYIEVDPSKGECCMPVSKLSEYTLHFSVSLKKKSDFLSEKDIK